MRDDFKRYNLSSKEQLKSLGLLEKDTRRG